MGNYNSEYEVYYNSMINKSSNKGLREILRKLFSKKKIIKRIEQELIGGIILFGFFIFCRSNIVVQCKDIYKISKNIINENLDISTIQNKYLKNIEVNTSEWVGKIKSELTGINNVKEKIQENFIYPVNGKMISSNNMGIDFENKPVSDVVCSSDGKVSEVGEDIKKGDYIKIDHGEGIVTVYSGLSQILLKKGNQVKKGDLIGKSAKTASTPIHFEIIYMGNEISDEIIIR